MNEEIEWFTAPPEWFGATEDDKILVDEQGHILSISDFLEKLEKIIVKGDSNDRQ